MLMHAECVETLHVLTSNILKVVNSMQLCELSVILFVG